MRQIRIPKAAELISRGLRNRIVRGELRAGDSLAPESDLMAQFGISRPTLREALRILESEGLLSISRGSRGGAVVHAPSLEVTTRQVSRVLQAKGTTLNDIYKVRMVVEPAAVRSIAQAQGAAAGPALRACLAYSHENFSDDHAFGVAAARFRNKLISLADIPVLSMLIEMLDSIFERYWAALTVTAGKRFDNSAIKRVGLRSQERLITLIVAGEADAAETHWRKHTVAVGEHLSKWRPASTVIDLLDHT